MIQLKNLIGLVPEDSMVTIMNKNDFAMLNNIVGGLVKESGKYLDAEVVYIYPDNFGSNIYGECNQIITIKC